MTQQRQKSQRLITTTPDTSLGAALESVKPQISPKLFDGLEIKKVSTKGVIAPRILTLSDDLFTLFISHHKVGNAGSLSDRFHYKSYKAYSTVVGALTSQHTVQNKHHLRVIDVADILFVQSGFIGSRKLEECKDKVPDLDPKRLITIFHNNVNTTDFVVEDEEDREVVLGAIQIIREAYHATKVRVGREEQLLRYAWYDTDWNKNGEIDQHEFLTLAGRLNIYLKQEKAIQLFKVYVAAKHTKKGRLGGVKQHGVTFDECLEILRKVKLMQNEGIETSNVIFDEIFGEYTTDVTADEFLSKFILQRQKEMKSTISIDDVKKIFSELNSMELSGVAVRLGADGKGDAESIDRLRFGEYLSSSRNDLFDPDQQKYDVLTMTKPLSHYFINSSHNTYLTGDQLKSMSSVEMYAVALQRGCKCLELDCWDDSVGHPIVYHGYTITSKIPFQDIITCVRGYVDSNPETLPIILSLENHCSHPFQEQMASILTQTLEECLYIPESNHDAVAGSKSPLDLVGRVVIKGKRPPEKEDDDMTVLDSMDEEALLEEALVDSVGDAVGSNKIKDALNRSSKKGDTPQLPKISPELARLTLFNGVKFKDFSTSLELPLSDMHSFSETKTMKVLNKDPDSVSLWREYNKDHMSRTYPAGSRVDSSNYNPVVAWHVGSQLVALNFQSDDSSMTVNDGRFRQNGGCGYVLKPPGVFPTDKESTSGKMILTIKVISGSCLPKPYGESVGEVIDPYVLVRVHDVALTKRSNSLSSQADWLETTERKTSSVRDNGFCPQWSSEPFEFTVNSEDVAMVEFVVMDSDKGLYDDTMCKSAVPVSCLRQGLRSVLFYDQSSSQHGPFEFARILVDVDIKCIM